MSIPLDLSFLGLKVRDSVTGYTGVVESISVDLYGCVQAMVSNGQEDKDGRFLAHWFDTSRITVVDPTPVMDQPNFYLAGKNYNEMPRAEGAAEPHGPADKPSIHDRR
jgi:hypothetical protein